MEINLEKSAALGNVVFEEKITKSSSSGEESHDFIQINKVSFWLPIAIYAYKSLFGESIICSSKEESVRFQIIQSLKFD